MLYEPDEVDVDYIRSAKVFHYGSITLIHDPSRGATLLAVEAARASGELISYDPNLRLALWPSPRTAKQGMMLGWPLAHFIKVSEEELAFLSNGDLATMTNLAAREAAARELWHPELRLMVITRGMAGCTYVTPSFCGDVSGFAVDSVDTTGAGDGFVAAVLKGLLEHPQADQDEAELSAIIRYANAVGAITTTERGAIPALPTDAQVEEFLKRVSVS
jgi:fructokinase